jgi:uncharacterized protein (UPF0276 family)
VPHYAHLFSKRPRVDFFEIVSENFMVEGGPPLDNLERALGLAPVVQHGVSLGIGSTTPLNFDYLARLKALARRTGTPWLTDHLAWTRVTGAELHDLLPMPCTEEAVRHVADRVRIVQDFLELRVGLENASSYLAFRANTMTEWEFLASVAEEGDCGILLDVNNTYVSAQNQGFDPVCFVDGVPRHRVLQLHLAGHTDKGTHLLDTHSDVVAAPVWALYRHALMRFGRVSTLVEWDDDIPAFDVVWGEAVKAATIRDEVLGHSDSDSGAPSP